MIEDTDLSQPKENGYYPVAPKVRAATLGAGAGAIISEFLVWTADEIWWNGAASPDVPAPVAAVITLVATSALAFIGGWSARHQYRKPV